MKNFIAAVAFLICYSAQSQIGMGIPNPDASSVLELTSDQKGFLPPRLTTVQRDSIPNPALGLTIYNTTKKCLEWYLSAGWYNACGDNGMAVLAINKCNTNASGSLIEGNPVSGVSQTITVDVSFPGYYEMRAQANGVTFTSSGNFTSTGLHDIVLSASGTPDNYGTHTFALNANTATCNFDRTTILTLTSPTTRIWMAYNLGATAPPKAMDDVAQYGDYYQWGRATDGHEKSTSPTTPTQSPTTSPIHGNFITGNDNWQTSGDTNLWQGLTGINNPCPSGFRLPTVQEWEDEIKALNITDRTTAYNSILKLTVGGWRKRSDGTFGSKSGSGFYWSDSVNKELRLKTSGYTGIYSAIVADGLNVRCIKD